MTGISLCDEIQLSNVDDKVTDEICIGSNMIICEVYVKEGKINGTDINTCTKYCNAFGLRCVEAFEDADDCQKDMDTPTDCDDVFTRPMGMGTKDNICSCDKIGENYHLTQKPKAE